MGAALAYICYHAMPRTPACVLGAPLAAFESLRCAERGLSFAGSRDARPQLVDALVRAGW